ncbi:hypothetical protein [Microlunatus speluncae]|uniref:hypothetical protein n=1 Tax=Microlunatus speluncae TaxID=2594267 RepID=UPI0012661A06|nr:hypothetical protein [Microlunatus speluncae]
MVMPSDGHAYVVRYSVSPGSFVWIALAGTVTVSSVRIAVTTNEPRALILSVLGGGLLLYLLITHLARLGKVALRVDSRGITFGGRAFRYRETTHVVPWRAIRTVVVYRTYGYRVQGLGGATGRFLGLHGTEAPIVLPERPDPITDPDGYAAMIKRLTRRVPHVPPDVTYASRRIWGWLLHQDRLTEVVRRFAPEVTVVDAG